MKKVQIVILAAGKGTRMDSDLPKVLVPVKGVPMIKRLLLSVEKSGVDSTPVIVVGYGKEKVQQELGDKYHYIDQGEPLGTGHAVATTKEYLKDKAENILVLYGDHPFTSEQTIKKIVTKHMESGKKLTMATVKLEDFNGWRANFVNFSRIVRDTNGKIIKDVQYKDATSKEIRITEVNPCYLCFNAEWLWKNLESIETKNAQNEYYLTDLIQIAVDNGEDIESIEIAPREALGANSKRELEIMEMFE